MGWPVDVLDGLLELRQLATRGEISLDQWREQDAAQRSSMPIVDTEEVREAQREWLLQRHPDVPSDVHSRLIGRLTALSEAAPSDEELWKQLAQMHEILADPQRVHGSREIVEQERDRIIR